MAGWRRAGGPVRISDIELHTDGARDALERAFAAVDAIRHRRYFLVSQIDNAIMLLDTAFRPIELWLHLPAGFWNSAEAIGQFVNKVRRRALPDRIKAATSVRRARERGRPAGMEHVPQAVFERERERLAAYLTLTKP